MSLKKNLEEICSEMFSIATEIYDLADVRLDTKLFARLHLKKIKVCSI